MQEEVAGYLYPACLSWQCCALENIDPAMCGLPHIARIGKNIALKAAWEVCSLLSDGQRRCLHSPAKNCGLQGTHVSSLLSSSGSELSKSSQATL